MAHKNAVYRLQTLAQTIDEQARERMAATGPLLAAQHQRVLWRQLSFAAIALALAALLATAITRSIVAPLTQARGMTERVASGDLRQRITASGRDETSRVLTALQHMSRALSALVSTIHQSSRTVHRSAATIARDSDELASRTEQQASALQQTATNLEELTQSVAQSADESRTADRLAETARQHTAASHASVTDSRALIERMATDSARMDGILDSIDSIAFQTNLLALNASVEAARAGEHGRGFAVVASEVRALAGRCATAAHQVGELLDQLRGDLTACARQAQTSAERMNHTRDSIAELSQVVTQMGSTTREQATGLSQIGAAVAELDSVTQHNAQLVGTTRAAATALERQAGELNGLVGRFQLPTAPEAALAASKTTPPAPAALPRVA